MKNFEETKKLLGNSSQFYIVTVCTEGFYTYVNQNYAKTFAHVTKNLVGQPAHITMHPDDVNTCTEVGAKCFANPDKLFPATIRKHDGSGNYIYTQWEYSAMFDNQNNPIGIFCLGYNITKFVAEEIQLHDAQMEIKENYTKMEKIMFQQAHLIRAPLSNIIGLTTILDKTVLDNNTSNVCSMLSESASQLDEVIRSIIKIGRS